MPHKPSEHAPSVQVAGRSGEISGLTDTHWRIVREDEAQTVLAVHLQALAGMESGLVRPDTLEHFMRHISADGAIIGAFVENTGMIAYGVLGIDSGTATHLADILDVNAADRSRFCILDGAASLPAWRGHRLHRDLIRERVKAAATLGRTLLGATVSPGNITSMRGLLESRFEIHRFDLLYGGLPRLVMTRDLRHEERRWGLCQGHRIKTNEFSIPYVARPRTSAR